ncbi:enoyl-CoA hydratase-related protein [Bdellovibrio sp. HCB337]|uniref:enoyl-CoA hydratase-related protein n=1 Tax=Bdellovibrio sp. HCB337 TaxID=3394358 RepID=UPI0039A40B54
MSFVEIKEAAHVAYVKLNRPDIRNAFDPSMIADITKAFIELEKRQDVRAIVLQGEGKVFCAGADLNWMREMVSYTLEQNKEDSLKLFGMFEAIAKCSLPVIGLVQGAAFGGALGLVACCDYVMADPQTQFCFSEVKLGIAPAVISAFINRKATPGKVRHFMMSGTVFNSQQALDAGLVNEIAANTDFTTRLEHILKQYKECGPEAVRETKKLLNDIPELSWADQRKRTSQLISERRVSAEGQEGLKSFLEKRSPSWRNS